MLVLFLFSFCSKKKENSATEFILWYNQPAGDDWMKTLPLGNGRLGGMVFGGIENEKIMLNENTVWSGWYREDNDSVGSYKAIKEIRSRLRKGKTEGIPEIMMKEVFTNKVLA